MGEVTKVRRYRAGYEIRTELVDGSEFGCEDFEIKQAFTTPEGHYIGDPVMAHRLIVLRGIKPEPREPACPGANGGRGRTCTIGFSERKQRWAGWSHRAIDFFGIGDTVDEGDCVASSGWTDEWLAEHPEDDLRLPVGFEAKTLEDARRMAIAFADLVS